MSDINTVTSSSSVSPIACPPQPDLVGHAPGEEAAEGLTLLLALDDGLLQHPEALERAGRTRARVAGEREEEVVDGRRDRRGRRVLRGGDGLDRLPLGDVAEQLFLGDGQAAVAADGADHGVDDLGVEHRTAGRDLAHGTSELIALGDTVLQEVPVPGRPLAQQRHGVVGVVVLRQHDHAGAGMALADLLGGVDALALERRGHANVGDEHLRRGLGGAGDQLVVVGGDTHDLEVGLDAEHRPHALADDDVVVGQEDRDPVAPHPVIRPRHAPPWQGG